MLFKEKKLQDTVSILEVHLTILSNEKWFSIYTEYPGIKDTKVKFSYLTVFLYIELLCKRKKNSFKSSTEKRKIQ